MAQARKCCPTDFQHGWFPAAIHSRAFMELGGIGQKTPLIHSSWPSELGGGVGTIAVRV